jgi:hypothetical protein
LKRFGIAKKRAARCPKNGSVSPSGATQDTRPESLHEAASRVCRSRDEARTAKRLKLAQSNGGSGFG